MQLSVSNAQGALYKASLAGKMDDVYVGLPEEYANSVFEGIIESKVINDLGGGNLRITQSAHGRIGSSPWLFKKLGNILPVVLASDSAMDWEKALIDILGSK